MNDGESRVVLITGVSGGIGSATARVFKEHGWKVLGVDRQGEATADTDVFIESDISEEFSMGRIFDRVKSEFGRLDAVVNNAAMQICKPIVEMTTTEFDTIIASNLRSVFLSMRDAFPLLKEVRGSVINVSSVHAMATSKNIAAYAASKGGLLAFTRATALEFGEYGVRVNTVLPGAVDTSMLHDGLKRGHIEGDSIEELVRGLGKKHVLGRVGRPDEIGNVIYFLADDRQSSFITGQSIVVDGGALARLSTE